MLTTSTLNLTVIARSTTFHRYTKERGGTYLPPVGCAMIVASTPDGTVRAITSVASLSIYASGAALIELTPIALDQPVHRRKHQGADVVHWSSDSDGDLTRMLLTDGWAEHGGWVSNERS